MVHLPRRDEIHEREDVVRLPNVVDTLQNLLTGLGTGKDPTQNSAFILTLLDRNVLENMYRSDWISRKVVNAPAEDMTREWRNWQANEDQIESLESCEKTHNIQVKVKKWIIRARLYGGAALVLGVDDGKDPSEPLDLDNIKQDSLKFVVVLNRYELNAGPRIYDVQSPWYTRPAYYTVATPMFGFEGESGITQPITPGTPPQESVPGSIKQEQQRATLFRKISNIIPFRRPGSISAEIESLPWISPVQIHPSRVCELAGNELPDWRLAPLGGGWGDSVLQTVDDALRDAGTVFGGIAQMIADAKVDVVKIPNLSKILSSNEYSSRLMQRFGFSNQSKSIINALLLDKEEEWERIRTEFGGLPMIMHEYITFVSGAAEIPVSRLFGQAQSRGLSGGGTGGAGDTDLRNYYDNCMSKQRTDLSPALHALDEVMMRSAIGKFDPDIYYDWAPLYKADPKEIAQIAFQKAQATQIYTTLALMNEDALRQAVVNQLIEDGTYPGLDDAIEEYGIEPPMPEPVDVLRPGMPPPGGHQPPPPPGEGPGGPQKPGQPGPEQGPQAGGGGSGPPPHFYDRPENQPKGPVKAKDMHPAADSHAGLRKYSTDIAPIKDVILIRHGCTSMNGEDGSSNEDQIRGWKDVPLSAQGKNEVNVAANSLAGSGLEHVYYSDLKRGKQTADPIIKTTGAEGYELHDLRPWDVGELTGQAHSVVHDKLEDYARNKPDEPVPGGESFNTFKERAFKGVKQAIRGE